MQKDLQRADVTEWWTVRWSVGTKGPLLGLRTAGKWAAQTVPQLGDSTELRWDWWLESHWGFGLAGELENRLVLCLAQCWARCWVASTDDCWDNWKGHCSADQKALVWAECWVLWMVRMTAGCWDNDWAEGSVELKADLWVGSTAVPLAYCLDAQWVARVDAKSADWLV